MNIILSNLPFLVTGVVAIWAPPAFRKLFKSLDAIEETEIAQNRKDWYITRY